MYLLHVLASSPATPRCAPLPRRAPRSGGGGPCGTASPGCLTAARRAPRGRAAGGNDWAGRQGGPLAVPRPPVELFAASLFPLSLSYSLPTPLPPPPPPPFLSAGTEQCSWFPSNQWHGLAATTMAGNIVTNPPSPPCHPPFLTLSLPLPLPLSLSLSLSLSSLSLPPSIPLPPSSLPLSPSNSQSLISHSLPTQPTHSLPGPAAGTHAGRGAVSQRARVRRHGRMAVRPAARPPRPAVMPPAPGPGPRSLQCRRAGQRTGAGRGGHLGGAGPGDAVATQHAPRRAPARRICGAARARKSPPPVSVSSACAYSGAEPEPEPSQSAKGRGPAASDSPGAAISAAAGGARPSRGGPRPRAVWVRIMSPTLAPPNWLCTQSMMKN